MHKREKIHKNCQNKKSDGPTLDVTVLAPQDSSFITF